MDSVYHVMRGLIRPHPLPTIIRQFQSLLGKETLVQFTEIAEGCLPDTILSPVGTGSRAVGIFYPFIRHETVRLVGIEAENAAPLTHGSIGILFGCKTYVLQDTDGQILQSCSASSEMNLSIAGPELAHWKDTEQVTYVTGTDSDALEGNSLEGARKHRYINQPSSVSLSHLDLSSLYRLPILSGILPEPSTSLQLA
ncbi:tryptophan synthase beta subunit-like PLP-dependent enzyme [Aspergillus cavernicola]|uniref:Tryptophan synthase beta subunit-like PLP-dependent enzyme n=1 Tax=Aspergillus cavernicola TaxID=176166 RepID=A0ABR4IVA7_9EURO